MGSLGLFTGLESCVDRRRPVGGGTGSHSSLSRLSSESSEICSQSSISLLLLYVCTFVCVLVFVPNELAWQPETSDFPDDFLSFQIFVIWCSNLRRRIWVQEVHCSQTHLDSFSIKKNQQSVPTSIQVNILITKVCAFKDNSSLTVINTK